MNVGAIVEMAYPHQRHIPLLGAKGKVLSFYTANFFPALVHFEGSPESVWCERDEIIEIKEATP